METSTKYNRYAGRIPRGMGVGGWGVGSLSFNVQGWWVGSLTFDVQGWWSLSRFGPIQTDRKREEGEGGGGCKNWTFFMDVIIVWSCTYFENGSSFFIKFQPKIPK